MTLESAWLLTLLLLLATHYPTLSGHLLIRHVEFARYWPRRRAAILATTFPVCSGDCMLVTQLVWGPMEQRGWEMAGAF
jgi:hypothetical protein